MTKKKPITEEDVVDIIEIRPLWQEAILIGAMALSAFIGTALYAASEGMKNPMGPAGQQMAWVLYSAVGVMAYVIPLGFLFISARLFKGHNIITVPHISSVTHRFVGAIMTLLAGASLAQIQAADPSNYPAGMGGLLGQAVGQWSYDVFSVTGSYLIWGSIGAVGLSWFLNISLLTTSDNIGGFLLLCLTKLKGIAVSLGTRIKLRIVAIRSSFASFIQRLKDRKIAAKEVAIAARSSDAYDALPGEALVLSNDYHESAQVIKQDKKKEKPRLLKKEAKEPVVSKKTSISTPQKKSGDVLQMPDLELLTPANADSKPSYDKETLQVMSAQLETKLAEFGVRATVKAVLPGPVVTRFEILPDAGVKVSKISNIAKDIARSLAVISVRVVEVIPGKPYVGIEIPNEDRKIVNFHEVIASPEFQNAKSSLTLGLGHDISGRPIVADLAKMPHLLVAGTTGSGKSVGVNSMLLSLLYKATPAELRLLLVDPKMLELSIYDGIPHLLAPVVTDMKDAASGLRWCVGEMERRYKLMSKLGVRNLAGFNAKIEAAMEAGEPIVDPLWVKDDIQNALDGQEEAPALEKLPVIVVVVDEFADMIMVVGKKVEELIARIAQKARAAGIHLILATQRPSVDVITGLIKANVPTRIAFQVSSKIDSRTILDQGGAEQLLGNGDMLYLPPGTAVPIRVHGAFVSDEEVHRVAEDWKSRGTPDYIDGVLDSDAVIEGLSGISGEDSGGDEESELFSAAVDFVRESERCSISAIQRKLKVGYNRASRFVEMMEDMGIVGAPNGNGVREIIGNR
jgi:S-DNA-T family DNA segregation ATPase FtsK/SpoIIIE